MPLVFLLLHWETVAPVHLDLEVGSLFVYSENLPIYLARNL